jgi:hypothetical protein
VVEQGGMAQRGHQGKIDLIWQQQIIQLVINLRQQGVI